MRNTAFNDIRVTFQVGDVLEMTTYDQTIPSVGTPSVPPTPNVVGNFIITGIDEDGTIHLKPTTLVATYALWTPGFWAT